MTSRSKPNSAFSEGCPYAFYFRGISYHFSDGVLTLRGRVPTYYLKQVLQQRLLSGLDNVTVENKVDVVKLARAQQCQRAIAVAAPRAARASQWRTSRPSGLAPDVCKAVSPESASSAWRFHCTFSAWLILLKSGSPLVVVGRGLVWVVGGRGGDCPA